MGASVTVLFGGEEQGVHPIDKPRMVVGRDEGCEIRIDNLGISRQHSEFLIRGDSFVVRDLGSANGTFVSGRRVAEHYLNDGDEIVIGVKYMLRFHNDAQAKAPASPDEAAVPGTMDTFIVDGAKIQAQLARMRAEREAAGEGGAPGAVGAPLAPHGATLTGAAQAAEVARLKDMLFACVAAIIVLLVAVVVLVFLLARTS